MAANVITIAILAVLYTLAIRHIISDKKKGIGSCGYQCSTCGQYDACSTTHVPERFKLKNKK